LDQPAADGSFEQKRRLVDVAKEASLFQNTSKGRVLLRQRSMATHIQGFIL
jgi:hypothetical protein